MSRKQYSQRTSRNTIPIVNDEMDEMDDMDEMDEMDQRRPRLFGAIFMRLRLCGLGASPVQFELNCMRMVLTISINQLINQLINQS